MNPTLLILQFFYASHVSYNSQFKSPDSPTLSLSAPTSLPFLSLCVLGPSTPVLLTLKADPHADRGPQPAVRELTVGCIRQAQPLKKVHPP